MSTTLDSENLYFIFENCENGDLAELIQTRKKLSLEVTRIYGAQMVQTFEFLQSKSVMHRDLKPQNILLDENFNLKFVSHLFSNFRLTLETQRKKGSFPFQMRKMKKKKRTGNLAKKIWEESKRGEVLWWEQSTT